ncbi:hypothetical protein [Actinomadura madurae]|uniref:hypothetical protein n=1 Tax=Actinomadura madurae TaxID=1993 RepID=UPI0027E33B3B|nr:hypothetical protein [Actinomadura madurae]
MNAALGLLAVLVLTAATGYFVAQEFAFVTADRPALAQRAAEGDRAADRALKVMGGCRSCCPARSSASRSPRWWSGSSPSPRWPT